MRENVLGTFLVLLLLSTIITGCSRLGSTTTVREINDISSLSNEMMDWIDSHTEHGAYIYLREASKDNRECVLYFNNTESVHYSKYDVKASVEEMKRFWFLKCRVVRMKSSNNNRLLYILRNFFI